jgi:putative protein kinase ArgK-like GTPase of G3E family
VTPAAVDDAVERARAGDRDALAKLMAVLDRYDRRDVRAELLRHDSSPSTLTARGAA